MTILVEDIGKFLGKNIEDLNGRVAGRLVGLSTTIRNEVTAVEVELATGELQQYPNSQLILKGESLLLAPSWKVEADDLKREFEVVTRRISALEALFSDGDIDKENYADMKLQYDSALDEMKTRRSVLVAGLMERREKLDQQARDLQRSLTDNKMLYTAGAIDSDAYRTVCDSIRAGLERVLAEKRDIEKVVEAITIADKAPEAETIQEPPQSQTKVETPANIPDVVVVHVRDEPAT